MIIYIELSINNIYVSRIQTINKMLSFFIKNILKQDSFLFYYET